MNVGPPSVWTHPDLTVIPCSLGPPFPDERVRFRFIYRIALKDPAACCLCPFWIGSCILDSDHTDAPPLPSIIRFPSSDLCPSCFPFKMETVHNQDLEVHICNPNIWKAEAGGLPSEAILGYVMIAKQMSRNTRRTSTCSLKVAAFAKA